MENKHELTEDLKFIETEIHNAKHDLKAIGSKLDIAYKYQEELEQRRAYANAKTKELQLEFFEKQGTITEMYNKMANIFNIFTANFYK